MIRRAFWRVAASLRDTCGTGGTSLEAAASPPAHSRLTVSIQSRHCANEKVWRENQALSPCWALKRAVFSGSDGPGHLFSTHMCRKWAFLPPALAYQSPLFISIKGPNGNFSAKQKSNNSSICGLLKMHLLPLSFPPQRRQLAGARASLIPDAGHIF